MPIRDEETAPTDDQGQSDPMPQDEAAQATGDRLQGDASVKRIAAAVAGALDGLVEALDRYDVTEDGKRAIAQAGDIARAAAIEGGDVARSPEMRELGERVSNVSHQTSSAVRERAAEVKESFTETVEHARARVDHAREEVKTRASAVAESGRRARASPAVVREELGGWLTAWKRGLVRSIAGMAAMAVFALVAFIVFTIALVVGLNALLGDPAGTFVVALVYLVVAGAAYAMARSARTRTSAERKERIANVREEARHVTRPVREAFGRGRSNI